MQLLIERCAGLDVHRDTVAAYFVEDTEDTEQLRQIEARLERMEALLTTAHSPSRDNDPSQHPGGAPDTDARQGSGRS